MTGLYEYFVEGAPSSITSNLETGSGILNGCDCTDHSLTLGDVHTASHPVHLASERGVVWLRPPQGVKRVEGKRGGAGALFTSRLL